MKSNLIFKRYNILRGISFILREFLGPIIQYLSNHVESSLQFQFGSNKCTMTRAMMEAYESLGVADTIYPFLFYKKENDQHTLSSFAYFYCLIHIGMDD